MPTPEEIYKAALEFYADESNYGSLMQHDYGRRAREALHSAAHVGGSVAPILKAENCREKSLKLQARVSADAAEQHGVWTDLSLLGLFYNMYETEMGSSYTLISGNARADLAHIKILVSTLGDLSIFALRAFFSPAMKWVVNKRLDFFSRDNVERFVRPLAHAMAQKDRRRPEWAAGTKARGLVHIPKGG